MNSNTMLKDRCVKWVRSWFEANCPGARAVIGMSGGKDSTVAAAVCAEALGRSRVIGVALPSTGQGLNDADAICAHLGIRFIRIPIGEVEALLDKAGEQFPEGLSKQAVQNIPPRIRMTVLYAVAQSLGGIVANTCNLSEDYIGYATLFGDNAGSFSPFGKLVAGEVRAIGHALGLPTEWVEKTPDDGLPGSMPDEEKFGFSYDVLDRYILKGECDDPAVKAKIDDLHRRNRFKTDIIRIPAFEPERQVTQR